MLTPLLIAGIIGYILGSLPFGYLVARSRGVNIFEVGSKNPGATNVRRVLGHGAGNVVLFLDALKGAVAAGWALHQYTKFGGTEGASGSTFLNLNVSGEAWVTVGVAGLIGALLGHSFSCFTRFKGGKGVATGAGGFFVLFPLGMLMSLILFVITLAVTRYVSLASMLGAVLLPVLAIVLHQSTVLVSVTGAVALFVLLRHRANISRLLAGTESKVGQKAAAAPLHQATPKS